MTRKSILFRMLSARGGGVPPRFAQVRAALFCFRVIAELSGGRKGGYRGAVQYLSLFPLPDPFSCHERQCGQVQERGEEEHFAKSLEDAEQQSQGRADDRGRPVDSPGPGDESGSFTGQKRHAQREGKTHQKAGERRHQGGDKTPYHKRIFKVMPFPPVKVKSYTASKPIPLSINRD